MNFTAWRLGTTGYWRASTARTSLRAEAQRCKRGGTRQSTWACRKRNEGSRRGSGGGCRAGRRHSRDSGGKPHGQAAGEGCRDSAADRRNSGGAAVDARELARRVRVRLAGGGLVCAEGIAEGLSAGGVRAEALELGGHAGGGGRRRDGIPEPAAAAVQRDHGHRRGREQHRA